MRSREGQGLVSDFIFCNWMYRIAAFLCGNFIDIDGKYNWSPKRGGDFIGLVIGL